MTTSLKRSPDTVGQTSIKTCRVSELKKAKNECINLNKIVSKFVAKLLQYRILFRTYLHLRLDYRESWPIIVYLVVIGSNITKTDNYITLKSVVIKVKKQHGRKDFLATIIDLLRFLNRT